jgi:hypothetical protein
LQEVPVFNGSGRPPCTIGRLYLHLARVRIRLAHGSVATTSTDDGDSTSNSTVEVRGDTVQTANTGNHAVCTNIALLC